MADTRYELSLACRSPLKHAHELFSVTANSNDRFAAGGGRWGLGPTAARLDRRGSWRAAAGRLIPLEQWHLDHLRLGRRHLRHDQLHFAWMPMIGDGVIAAK